MIIFPDPEKANSDGFLCWGGNIEPQTLLSAYSQGIFPWSGANEPITWWSPDPRCILFLEDFSLPRRSRRYLKKIHFQFSVNTCFERVLKACAAPRKEDVGTWLHPQLMSSLSKLNKLGYAFSVETWLNNELVGGLYGLTIGKVFCGESMFHTITEASRAAIQFLVSYLKEKDFLMIDCQQVTPHMLAMGAKPVPRKLFLSYLRQAIFV